MTTPDAAMDQDGNPPSPLTEDEEAVWRALTRMMVVLPNVLERDLRSAGELTLNEYVVLVNVSEQDGRSMRMSELAAVSNLSSSGVTRLVERLEGWGLINRVRDCTDARGQRAVLTETGLAKLEAAYPHHLRGVRAHVMDHLAGLDLPALAEALSKVAADEPGPALHGSRRIAKLLTPSSPARARLGEDVHAEAVIVSDQLAPARHGLGSNRPVVVNADESVSLREPSPVSDRATGCFPRKSGLKGASS